MSEPSPPPIESVSGGSHGVRAGYEQLLALAGTFEDRAADFVAMAGLGMRVMGNSDLVESSVLSPETFASAERHVLDATTGADGVAVRAIGIEADAVGVRAVVAAFRASDAMSRHATERLDHTIGAGIAVSLPVLLATGAIGCVHLRSRSPAEREHLLARLGDDLGQLVHDHPRLAQHLLNGAGGLLEGLGLPVGVLDPGDGPPDAATTNDAARLLALLLGNDTAVDVARLDDVAPTDTQATPPASLADLMRSLQDADSVDAHHPERHGAIQIQRIVGEDGRPRFVVYVPGTDELDPFSHDGARARDMQTNYQLVGGLDSAYGNGIAEGMREAGLRGQDVMLVGHSQGGMVATSLAADPDFTREFCVKHVVTAGSPTAQVTELPSATRAIHFENLGDAVPLLDGEDNPDQPGRTTVTFDQGTSHLVGNHGIDRYVAGATAADASTHGSIRSHIAAMRDDGFLAAGTVSGLDTFQITRRRD